MPKQIRYAIKQKLTSVQIETQKAMDKVTEVGAMFEKEHPDLYEILCAIAQGYAALKEAVENFSNGI
jgi:exonuclease VII small subunit